MVRRFCYRQLGRDFGPFTADEIRSEAAGGRIELDAIVWEQGTTTGVYAKDVVGLFSSAKNGRSAEPKTPQPPPLRLVSDQRIFDYVEFLFYREMRGFDEEHRVGVFTAVEASERQRALLDSLRRIRKALGQERGRALPEEIETFYGHVEERYHDLERVRYMAADGTEDRPSAPLDGALLEALIGAAAGVFVPWDSRNEPLAHRSPEHRTVVEEGSKTGEPMEKPELRPNASGSPVTPREMSDGDSSERLRGVKNDDPGNGFGGTFSGVSENWD